MAKGLDELKELILVLEQDHRVKNSLFGNGVGGKNTKLVKLYEGIASGQYRSDEEAAIRLYPDESNASYRKLKFTLREKLIKALFDLDLKSSDHNEYQKAYYECYRNWAAVKILLGKNANNAALSIALKLYQQAERFEFTSLSLDIASILRLHYAIREGNIEKYKVYNQHFDHYMHIYTLEAKAERMYLDVIIPEVTSKEIRSSEVVEFMKDAYEQSIALLETGNSYRLNLYVALIQLTYFSAKKDYAAAVNLCQEHINYFHSKVYEAHVPLQILYYQKMICLFNLKRYAEGRELAMSCDRYMTVGGYNWFKCREMLVQMALYDQNYNHALELFHQAINHPRFLLLPENVSEVWMVLKAYLYFLTQTQSLGMIKKNVLNTFRSHKFSNETLLYAKDKRGLNIAIQIVQFIIVLVANKRAEAIDQAESLKQYTYRYLRKEEYQRSRIFIKMLIQIPFSGFKHSIFIAKGEELLQKLQKFQDSPSTQYTEIEFIPYEHIWRILCNYFIKMYPNF